MREGSYPGGKHKLEGWLQRGSSLLHTETVLSDMYIKGFKGKNDLVIMVFYLPKWTTKFNYN